MPVNFGDISPEGRKLNGQGFWWSKPLTICSPFLPFHTVIDLQVFIRFLDMITIAVPPALPACLAIATVLSIGRLRRRDVFVTSPERVAMAGQLDVVCFDKTGGGS